MRKEALVLFAITAQSLAWLQRNDDVTVHIYAPCKGPYYPFVRPVQNGPTGFLWRRCIFQRKGTLRHRFALIGMAGANGTRDFLRLSDPQ